MSYTSWIEAVKSVGLWVESVASDKARQKGLIHVGKGRYKEKEDGPVVAKSSPDGETLLKVEPGDPEAQPEKEPKSETKDGEEKPKTKSAGSYTGYKGDKDKSLDDVDTLKSPTFTEDIDPSDEDYTPPKGLENPDPPPPPQDPGSVSISPRPPPPP